MMRAAEPSGAAAALLGDAEDDDDAVTAAVDIVEGRASGCAGGAGWSVFAIKCSWVGCWISCGFVTRAGVGSRRACACGVTGAGAVEWATACVLAGGAASSTRRISIVACTGAATLGRGRKSGFTIWVSRTAQRPNAIKKGHAKSESWRIHQICTSPHPATHDLSLSGNAPRPRGVRPAWPERRLLAPRRGPRQ